MNLNWLLKMAWRDSRKNKGRLFLFMSSIVLGIAALVAINSFGENLKNQIDGEARELLGADLEVESRIPISDDIRQFFDSLQMEMSEEMTFASMVLFPQQGGTRLVNVRAVESEFPFYGEIITEPKSAASEFTNSNAALVDQTLLLQYNAAVGDEIKLGEVTYTIAGKILKVPGQSGITTSVAPPVFIPKNTMEASGLLQRGSRVVYRIYLKYPENFDNGIFEETIKPRLEKTDLRFDDVAERKEELGDAYSDLTGFLNLTAFIALLLGCIGVASSVHIYMKEKVQAIAILRCLGAQGKQGVGIYLLQIVFMGTIGAALGAILGVIIQYFLPQLFADFLPFKVELALSWSSVWMGIAVGVITAVLFALFPLLKIRKTSPLKALRASYENPEKDNLPLLVHGLILLFIYFFSYVQLDNAFQALLFTAGLLVAAAVLSAVAKLIVWMVRRFFPAKSSFIWRQGLSNLYRPNNQTLILIITIGLGTALISTLFLSQQLLVDKVKFSSAPVDRPNMVLFDIQTQDIDSVKQLTRSFNLPVIDEVPIVTMRLHKLKGIGVEALKEDTANGIRNWVLRREYRVTYSDSLTDSETLISGKWQHRVEHPGDSIFISLEEGLAEDMKVSVGDPLSFNVQGAIIKTYVGSIRKIDWQRVQTNFLVVFPEGVLEQAPKFHVILTRFDSVQQSATFQQQVVRQYPNISVVDLNLILKTVDEVISRVSFVIRFMAFFSIITGILVLIGSVIISKYQRIQESVLLRTMGAGRKQILRINAIEYFLLGSLSALTGIFIACLSSWALAEFAFDTLFIPKLWPLAITYLSITGLTVLIGLSNSREVLNKPPLEILRREG